MPLVRIGRLSVMPVVPALYQKLLKLGVGAYDPSMSRLVAFAGCVLVLSLPAAAQRRAAQAPAGVDTSLYNALEWRSIGPFRGGRVTAVAGHADQPSTFYFGATAAASGKRRTAV